MNYSCKAVRVKKKKRDFGSVYYLATCKHGCIVIYSDEEWDEVSTLSGVRKAVWRLSRNSCSNVFGRFAECVTFWAETCSEQLAIERHGAAAHFFVPVSQLTAWPDAVKTRRCHCAASLLELHFSSWHRSCAPYVPPTWRKKSGAFCRMVCGSSW